MGVNRLVPEENKLCLGKPANCVNVELAVGGSLAVALGVAVAVAVPVGLIGFGATIRTR